MSALSRTLAVVALVLALVACGGARRGQRSMDDVRTTITVENRSWNQVVVYAVRSSQRVRLGSVPAVNTRTFTIPRTLLGPATPLRFQADPIGGNAAGVSQELVVHEGDRVQMYIPPR